MRKLFSLLSAFGMTLLSVGVAMAAEGAAAAGGDSTKAAIAIADLPQIQARWHELPVKMPAQYR